MSPGDYAETHDGERAGKVLELSADGRALVRILAVGDVWFALTDLRRVYPDAGYIGPFERDEDPYGAERRRELLE